MEDDVNQLFNWSNFYTSLCQFGPDLLMGIDDGLREVIKELSTTTDMFWTEGLEEFLAIGAAEDTLKEGILQALDQWKENIVNEMDGSFGISLDLDEVSINANSPLIDVLMEAATH